MIRLQVLLLLIIIINTSIIIIGQMTNYFGATLLYWNFLSRFEQITK